MNWDIVNGLLTLLLIILFLGIFFWAWHPKRKDTFSKMAALPLEDQNNHGENDNDE